MRSANPEVILRLGTHAEKQYFLKTVGRWEGVIVGANLLEVTPGATASLIVKFSGKKHKIPYYIDPMTYAFGTLIEKGMTRTDLDWIKSDQKIKVTSKAGRSRTRTKRAYKRSYRKLAKEFGGPVEAALNRNSGISTLARSEIDQLGDAVVQYQASRVRREFESDSEYESIADMIPRPAALFAPYFFINPKRMKDGFRMFFQCAVSAVKIGGAIPIHAVFCTDVSILSNQNHLRDAATLIKDSGVAGVWLWFSRFYEETADQQLLINFRMFVENLRKKLVVYNMHGGYFSLALSRFGLNGVSHGVGYGEQKDIFPVIGQSTPTVRYYLPDLRRRLGVPQIERAFKGIGVWTLQDFFNKICDCAICRGVIQSDISQFSEFGDLHYSTRRSKRKAQTPAAAKRCRYHFLLNRFSERDFVASRSPTQIAQDFRSAYNKWSRQPTIRGAVDHLPKWEAVLRY